jgi:hypothetical protein
LSGGAEGISLAGEDRKRSVDGMLTLRITQKLARRLSVELPAEVPVATNPCADWCCQPFTFGRYRYLMVTHATTFFSVAMSARGAGNEGAFEATVIAGLREYLTYAGHRSVFEQLIAPQLLEIAFSAVGDRRILGVMNEFSCMAPYYLSDLSAFETSDRLNCCPVSPLGSRFPKDLFPSVDWNRSS